MKRIYLIYIIIIFVSCATKLTENQKNNLNRELEEMVKIDQIAAYIPQGKYKDYSEEEWKKFKDSVFTNDKVRIEKMFSKYGFLGFEKVGKVGSNNFWLLVQHCDEFPEFQKKVLIAMEKEVKKDNANPNNYAYLYDRVQINSEQKQKFGTQVTYDVKNTGRAYPKIGLLDSINIDIIRKEYDLKPLKEYLNEMTKMHYEMNLDHYQKKGISKPYSY